MASYTKRLRGYIAPIFVAYTLLVTYFLAQRAWDDVSDLLRRRNEVKFLDVLVQEERRHLRSFQNVVDNYRGEQLNAQKEGKSVNYNMLEQDLDLPSEKNAARTEPDSRSQGSHRLPNESEPFDVTYFPKDSHLEVKEESQNNGESRPFFQVEVEEWDASASRTKQHQPKSSNISLVDPALPRFDDQAVKNNHQNVDLKSSSLTGSINYNHNTMQPRKEGNLTGDQAYTTEFCENVSDVLGLKPSICMRELAEKGTKHHVPISSYSLLFRELGDTIIFSAFLDTRDTSYVIRLITLGHQGLDNSKSIYWCVFYQRSVSSNSNQKVVSGLNTTTAGYRRNHSRHGTQLVYYSASDGHNRNSQFYIMSCSVPESVKSSLLPPYRGLFQIVIGDLQRPFLDTSQESITLKVIINNPESTATPLESKPQPSYFDNMEYDLLSLNPPNIAGNYQPVNNNNNNSHTSSRRHSHISKDRRVELENVSLRNVSDSKIVTCVAPLQAGLSVVQLVEFIELSLLLGSQHLVFYTFQVTEETTRVLSLYVARGLVTVLPWNIPNPQSVWANGRDMALNDCLYRTMHVYDYALFLDIDEFLVPRITPDIPSFLKYLKTVHKFNSTKFSDLVFSSAYFPPPTKIQHKNLTTVEGFTRDITKFVSLKSVHRTYINLKHTLRLIKLSRALRVGAGERKRTSFTISPRFAFVNHYSYCPQDANHARKDKGGVVINSQEKNSPDICNRTKQDFVMWRYRSVLIQRVKDSVRRLNGG